MFKIPKASKRSPHISTNCCLESGVKPRPKESIKYLKSNASLFVNALNNGVPFVTTSSIADCFTSVPSGIDASLILNPLRDIALYVET
jgi:hypothetical protein